jgi:hypothetical protein
MTNPPVGTYPDPTRMANRSVATSPNPTGLANHRLPGYRDSIEWAKSRRCIGRNHVSRTGKPHLGAVREIAVTVNSSPTVFSGRSIAVF